jgi:hypothetical protein
MIETKTYENADYLAGRFDQIIAAALFFTRADVRQVTDRFGVESFVTFNAEGEAVVYTTEPPAAAASPMRPTVCALDDAGRFAFYYPTSGTLEVEAAEPDPEAAPDAPAWINFRRRRDAGEPLELVSVSELLRRIALRKIGVYVWNAVSSYAAARAKFLENFATSPAYALQWAGGLAGAFETARLAVEPLQHFAAAPDFETLRARVEELAAHDRERAVSGFRIPSSSSHFSNAVEGEQVEARIKFAFDHFGGLCDQWLNVVRYGATAIEDAFSDKKRATARERAADAGLTLWNGRGTGTDFAHFYVAAKTQAEAVRLLKKAGHRFITAHELKTYFSKTWGGKMEGITPERGVWAETTTGDLVRLVAASGVAWATPQAVATAPAPAAQKGGADAAI